MLSRGRSKERSSARKVTPPSPSYMTSDQFAAYLASLRDSRQARPAGARPPPSSTSLPRHESERPAPSRPSIGAASIASQKSLPILPKTMPAEPRVPSGRPSLSGSMASRYSAMSTSTRDYYPDKSVAPLKPGQVVPSATYIERGQRWMEKEEAVSLRQAMVDMDLKDQKPSEDATDETRLYTAALDEAAELVWRHQNGVKPPQPGAPYAYKSHLRQNSYAHARAASAGRYGTDIVATGLARDRTRSVSGSSSGSDGRASPDNSRGSLEHSRDTADEHSSSKSYGALERTGRRTSSQRRRSSLKRNISGEIQKPFSGDQIWEEPESNTYEKDQSRGVLASEDPLKPNQGNATTAAPTAIKAAVAPTRATTAPPSAFKLWSRREIHKNPPSQSRNAGYTTNSPFDRRNKQVTDEVPKKNGIEIRGDDIRQATTMRLQDRSAKLPTPSAVSDSPGRPIVSFDKNWKAPEQGTDSRPEVAVPVPVELGPKTQGPQSQPTVPTITTTPHIDALPTPQKQSAISSPIPSIRIEANPKSSIPAIIVGDTSPPVPTIVLPGDESFGTDQTLDKNPTIPIIVTPDDDNGTNNGSRDVHVSMAAPKGSARPLPTPTRRTGPSQQTHSWDDRRRSHWSPAPNATARVTALCHECQLPIEGKVVALGGSQERFHPQCFRCHTCGTRLEALEISPEPDNFRAERLDRIRRRAAGELLDETPGQTMGEDGDERLRFFCHLDWHEHFAPRCKHCKTSILGEHIVALGAHWHYGHFFCAECGDPFKQGMTHIEKDGYAWCVNCQTKRTERRAPKCRNCKKAVIGQYIQALGGEWHDECFRCATCHGGFDDGQIFPVSRGGENIVLCTMCRASELKM
ncbi:uncharacterized protein B0I36DRAFT_376140 [Microdochium trichocladiopsis]|uniref:LIM zinc-binding domain-containing protein n=1 Tax=Microdochium trichocladiopsis TaxID=1682393 RepID=A0A9P9BMK1_9PEZI|nr:uncharacterized protein B0I36DRAFT_376140 [Microdochium trichocladiopsis]KAH7026353.1 hypothetical protein B0I36DRAFT_376140 [Microdochium trichocladiopsis]